MGSHRRYHRWFAAFGFSLALTGCNGFEPNEARRIDPPAEFRAWWEKTEACSERTGDFDKIEFYEVPGNSFKCPSGDCVGRWEPGHKIYLAQSWSQAEMVVRHEMLHELLGHAGHPDPPFGAGCPLTWVTWPGSQADHARLASGVVID